MRKSEAGGAMSSTLLTTLEPQQRYKFLQPDAAIYDAAIDLTKGTLDAFAGRLVDEQTLRLQAKRKEKKRKRGDAGDEGSLLKIRKVHTQGFGVDQVWEQARRVIDALRSEVSRGLEELDVAQNDKHITLQQEEGIESEGESGDGGSGLEGEDDEPEGESEVDVDEDVMMDGDEEEFEDGNEDGNKDAAEDENDAALYDELEDENEYDSTEDEEESPDVFVPDPHGLNDGFFSIDDFNKQTEFLEQQDAAADLFTGEASDEEEIDWEADPTTLKETTGPSSTLGKAKPSAEEDDENSDKEDGPTFGDVDLNAPEGESDDEEDEDNIGMGGDVTSGDNTNDILYKDFFEPPPRKIGRGEREKNYLERQARKPKAQPEEEEAEMERAISDVRRDLFDEMSENEESEDALSDVDPADPKSRKSAHERRQAKLAEEIRRLEAASVAKREWTLSGEARAADRPMNSLLEEDLDFERTGKPVPVITAEVSESIEDLIKRRILAEEFDELIRRRPDSDSVPANARRGKFELDDSKAQQSLAEMYEEEHIKATNPDTYVSKADEKLKQEHREIEGLWKGVSAKLDALSSWHYKPKPPAPSLTVVADVATVSMEDAQPSTAAGLAGGESMLAPQEIYAAGKNKETVEKGEVVPKSGVPIARQEMTREEKLRRRRREKERIRKSGGNDNGKKVESKKSKERKDTVSELKKAGVKVINRKGEIRDVDGNALKGAAASLGAGSFKL